METDSSNPAMKRASTRALVGLGCLGIVIILGVTSAGRAQSGEGLLGVVMSL